MYRIGEGYDVHKLVEGRELILGGVIIPYEKGLLGHSDADVLTHSIMDSLFGAVALGDIGRHFPDSDMKYKGANSLMLLSETKRIIEENFKSFDICNIDATIICEKPKLKDYIDLMRDNLSKALSIDMHSISIKATTEEGLGFTGIGAGIAARAIALVDCKT